MIRAKLTTAPLPPSEETFADAAHDTRNSTTKRLRVHSFERGAPGFFSCWSMLFELTH